MKPERSTLRLLSIFPNGPLLHLLSILILCSVIKLFKCSCLTFNPLWKFSRCISNWIWFWCSEHDRQRKIVWITLFNMIIIFFFGSFYENSKSLLKSTNIYIYRWKSGYDSCLADYIPEPRHCGNICKRRITGFQSQVGVFFPNKFQTLYIFTEILKYL